ncbi:MAG: hypothetical protein OXR84_02605 [Magnetovibrio sp.]|nr:hypothetical protein [Magnetovibrio sp.]
MNLIDALTAVTQEATVNRTAFSTEPPRRPRRRWWRFARRPGRRRPSELLGG